MEPHEIMNPLEVPEMEKLSNARQKPDSEVFLPNLLILSYNKEHRNIVNIYREMKQIRVKTIISNPIILKILNIHADNINSFWNGANDWIHEKKLDIKIYKSWTNDSLKLRILELRHLEGVPISEISRRLLVPYSTVFRIIRRFQHEPKMISRFFTSKPVDILRWKRAQKAALEYINLNVFPFNSVELQRFILKTTGIMWSKSGILRYLKKYLNLSYKRVSSRLVKSNPNLTKLKKIIFWVEYANMVSHKIVVVNIDETLFSNSTKKNYSWAARGWPAHTENIWFSGSVSIIAAITNRGNFYYSTLTENNNSLNFIDYLKNLMKWLDEDLKLWRREIILLMDNSPIHTSKIWKDFFNSLGWVTLFLPPYSPEYAPVELFFNVIKQRFVFKWKGRFVKLKLKDSIWELKSWIESVKEWEVLSFWTQTTRNILSTIT